MRSLSAQEIKLVINEMEKVAGTLDIPIGRHRDAGWIIRNAPINNPPSTKLEKLLKLAKVVVEHMNGGEK
jgi:hypothetical protein